MSREFGGASHENQDWKAPILEVSAENDVDLTAEEKAIQQPFDVKAIGPVQVDRKSGTPDGKFTITAEHEFVKLPPEIALKYDKNASELPVGGKVFKGENLAEEYKIEYAQMPDGSIRTASQESNFADGSKETIARTFDEQGRATGEKDVLDGQLRTEVSYTYGPDGKKTEVVRKDYDETGKEVQKFISKVENGKVITLASEAGGEERTIDIGKKDEADLDYLGVISQKKSGIESVPGRLFPGK